MNNKHKRIVFWVSMPFFTWSFARVADAYLQSSMEAADSYMSVAWRMMPMVAVILGVILAGMELESQWKSSNR